MVAFAHQARVDEALLLALSQLWGAPARTVHGEPIPEEALRDQARRMARRQEDVLATCVPPALLTGTSRAAPCLSIVLSPVHAWELPSLLPPVELRLGALAGGPLGRLATLFADDAFDARDPRHSDALLEGCRRVQALLGAAFALGDERLELVGEPPRDARRRAWSVAYYGPALVAALGPERVAAAPAHRVERTPEGGAWVILDPLPFLPSPAKERARRTVEDHLALASASLPPLGHRFPQDVS